MSERAKGEAELDGHDGVFLDLDGTVYTGTEPVAGAAETTGQLRAWGVGMRYVTNNAASTAAEVAERLCGFGLPAEAGDVHTSADAAGSVLRERLPAGALVLVLGTESLVARVRDAGLEPVRAAQPGVDAVVQGHSPDTGWRELAEACLAIRAGALWVACNADATLPSERGELPGNGAMVGALRTATGAEPVVAGKPHPPLLTLAARESGCRNPLVVGDRMETDIAGADASRMDALLVLSGVTTAARLLAAGRDERPRYVAADLTCLTGSIADLEVRRDNGARSGWRVEPDDTELRVSSTCESSALSLLRELCARAWDAGVTAVRAEDDRARVALAELDLPLAASTRGIR